MYDIGRAEAARFERDSRCFELHSRVLRATQQKDWAPFRSLIPHIPLTSVLPDRMVDLILESLPTQYQKPKSG